MPYLYQTDPEWSHESYSNGRLRHQGCGPTALSMVYIELTGKTDMDPAAMCRFATKSGFSTDQDGTSWSIMTDGAAQLGLTGTQLSVSEARLRAELEAGRPVICIMNPGHFTSSGHYIAIEKLDADGKAVVHDSNSSVRSQKTWDLSINRLRGRLRLELHRRVALPACSPAPPPPPPLRIVYTVA